MQDATVLAIGQRGNTVRGWTIPPYSELLRADVELSTKTTRED